ncbi:MAG: AraC family transcriptional regulator [Clostridia bacterium]|nr:AraC family transcriptional regulator [Clostridia bacterium]
MIRYYSKILSYTDGDGYNHNEPKKYPTGQSCFEPHAHDHLEFIFVLEGEYLFRNGEKEGLYKAGEVFIVNCGELHAGRCLYTLPQNSYRYLQIDVDRLSERLNRELIKIDDQTTYHHHIHAEDAEESGLWEIGNRLLEVVLRRNKNDELEILGLSLLFLNTLSAHRRFEKAEAAERTSFRIALADYVEEHYAERITVEQVAHALGYDKSYFCRKLKKETGRTFSRYLRASRMNKFLSHPALNLQSIAQCASDVGYTDYAYFYQVFHKCYHMSPREYLMRRAREIAANKH